MKSTLKWMLGAAFLATSAMGATTGQAEEIRIGVGCPAVPVCGDWVWAEDLAAKLKADGFEATVYPGGALGKDPELVDQLAQGLLQFGLTNFVMINEIDPRIQGFMAPYMFDSMDHMFRTVDETDILASIDGSMQKQGIRIAGLIGLGGTVGIFNSKKPIETPADLEGMRIRAIDATQTKLIEEWGASSVVIDMPEFMTGMQQGMADGYVNPPVVALIFQHTDYLKYYTDSGSGTPFRSALMSNDWYESLSDEDRAKIDAAIKHTNDKNRDWTEVAAAKELEQLREKGVEITSLTPEAREDFIARSKAAWPSLMPADAIEAFVAAAEKTRR
ncbi:TRAP transporter substrate-binding protein [Aerobium aerolatum]|uniref:TRAP-type C4-dicarboxylate transport system, substrate-binding protein n=1 Tax=Aquamicrobium aerolatum DSM 21857 TaxID=1121003 RepID=A0A1I3RG66_9HYPH|nr:TRAP transporter substrate-binding protein [Aquamicrobium aerolatum]SFJ44719.1 TRAP-type C4-dicarboxylate transport system, substrate-binding protein [Aquamicrobium aerolatum DSM 21857]